MTVSDFTLPEALQDDSGVQLPACLLEAGPSTEFQVPEPLQEETETEISLPPALVEDEEDEEDDEEPREPGRFHCSDCGRFVTRSASGKEYGHRRRPRCPRRETNVDPGKGAEVSRAAPRVAVWSRVFEADPVGSRADVYGRRDVCTLLVATARGRA